MQQLVGPMTSMATVAMMMRLIGALTGGLALQKREPRLIWVDRVGEVRGDWYDIIEGEDGKPRIFITYVAGAPKELHVEQGGVQEGYYVIISKSSWEKIKELRTATIPSAGEWFALSMRIGKARDLAVALKETLLYEEDPVIENILANVIPLLHKAWSLVDQVAPVTLSMRPPRFTERS